MPIGTGKGVLKLKGDDLIKKKKKKKKDKELALLDGQETKAKETPEGKFLEPAPENADRRTAAEKRFDEQREKREGDQIAKMTAKSHRQRIAEFNEHLGSLTEHMDIPKVGPG